MRLDLFLYDNNFAPSRNKANELIVNGNVFVNGKNILKPAYDIRENDKVEVKDNDVLEFVSRGGLKLKKALDYFQVDLKDKVILDIGASTGGFTDCCLKNGAKKVYSLDVGTNQLHPSLLNNSNVISIENTNFKDINKEMFLDSIDLYVCDVSFISITTILRKLKELDDQFSIIILYKPQFEVGKNNLKPSGKVKNEKAIIQSLYHFVDFLKSLNIGIKNATYSPISGHKENNIEYLFYLKSNVDSIPFNIEKMVNESYKKLG